MPTVATPSSVAVSHSCSLLYVRCWGLLMTRFSRRGVGTAKRGSRTPWQVWRGGAPAVRRTRSPSAAVRRLAGAPVSARALVERQGDDLDRLVRPAHVHGDLRAGRGVGGVDVGDGDRLAQRGGGRAGGDRADHGALG